MVARWILAVGCLVAAILSTPKAALAHMHLEPGAPEPCETRTTRDLSSLIHTQLRTGTGGATPAREFELIGEERLCFEIDGIEPQSRRFQLRPVSSTASAHLVIAVEKDPTGRYFKVLMSFRGFPVLEGEAALVDDEGVETPLLPASDGHFRLWPRGSDLHLVEAKSLRLKFRELRQPEFHREVVRATPPPWSHQPRGKATVIMAPTLGYFRGAPNELNAPIRTAGYESPKSYSRAWGWFLSFRLLGGRLAVTHQGSDQRLRTQSGSALLHLRERRTTVDLGWDVWDTGRFVLYPYGGLGVGVLTLDSKDALPFIVRDKKFPRRDASIGSAMVYLEAGFGFEQGLWESPSRVYAFVLGTRVGYQTKVGQDPWTWYTGKDDGKSEKARPQLSMSGITTSLQLGFHWRGLL